MNTLLRFYRDESGATAIEYALIAALLSIVIIGGVTLTGESLQSLYGSIASKVAAALISIS
jgi:pilus assembly protein Flp/PilA